MVVEMGEPKDAGHKWPKNGEHLWGPWSIDKPMPNATQWRACIHPECKVVETRPAPTG